MKELTLELMIEQKAQRYDEALGRAKKWYNAPNINNIPTYGNRVIEEIFPESKENKESEDERIKKLLIEAVIQVLQDQYCSNRGVSKEKVVAWLGKQGEQKPADKVEPKFHKDEWIVWQNKYYKVNDNDCGYELIDQNGLSTSLEYGTIDENAHLWDITKDVKDGDVLVTGKENIFIFKSISDCTIYDYCGLYFGKFEESSATVNGSAAVQLPIDYVPATKEQLDILFTKMKEAGYEFDFEKKELKKIEQKQIIDYPDNLPKDYWEFVHEFVEKFGRIPKDEDELSVLVKYVLERWKPTDWSKEDEKKRNLLIDILNVNHLNEYFKVNPANTLNMEAIHTEELVDWLKSLKDRVYSKQEWKQENTSDLTDFENAMMHIGDSFFGQHAGLDPNDTNAIKEQANLLLKLVPSKEWSKEDEEMWLDAIKYLELFDAQGIHGNKAVSCINWLKALKDRVQPQPKQEWSEEDKDMIQALNTCINTAIKME